jgi:hypothetical protein
VFPVVVSNRRAFDAIASHPDVYLVDLSVEQDRRATGERDVVMNDVYWDLAGW